MKKIQVSKEKVKSNCLSNCTSNYLLNNESFSQYTISHKEYTLSYDEDGDKTI